MLLFDCCLLVVVCFRGLKLLFLVVACNWLLFARWDYSFVFVVVDCCCWLTVLFDIANRCLFIACCCRVSLMLFGARLLLLCDFRYLLSVLSFRFVSVVVS